MRLKEELINKPTSIAPLTSFRVLFGFIMTISIIRFAFKGWIHELYIEPTFYFPFYGFEWIKPLSPILTYGLFVIIFLTSIGVMFGYRYRLSIVLFFLSFTYVELIDKTNYLNHYYFVSIVSFLLIWLPAHRDFSMDVQRKAVDKLTFVSSWCVNCVKLQILLVYFFAGIAKLNYYWLYEAMPLKLWLPAKSHLPIIGALLEQKWVAYGFSWIGALYDLTIGALLLWPKTRIFAFASIVAFHIMTALLFQIGMFPYIMMLCTLIFVSADRHIQVQNYLKGLFNYKNSFSVYDSGSTSIRFGTKAILMVFFLFQLILPFRYLVYPGDLFWTEQGYRFSWRVMLMEKAGHTTFKIEDDNGRTEWVQNYEHLTPQQEKMMSTQPDMILQYAHYLRDFYANNGFVHPKVYCNSKVTLNGRRSQALVRDTVNLGVQVESWQHKNWVTEFQR